MPAEPISSAPDVPGLVQLKVWLLGISPMIWRRIVVPNACTLRELHGVIQVAMGWEGIHLYQFRLRAVRYGSFDTPCGEHVLDWFHITMRLTVLGQYAKGVVALDQADGARLLTDLDRIKWRLWHGDIHRALEEIEDFEADVDELEVACPNLGRFRRAAHEFAVYIAANAGSVINYGERFRTGERISTAFVESTVNTVLGKRFAKKQQMQWTRRGAHLLLQTRTRALDGTLRATFERWYPRLANDNTTNTDRAAVA
jgi:hypothetical protein